MEILNKSFYKDCIPCNGLIVSRQGEESIISPHNTPELSLKYCTNNGVLVFVNEKGKTYVTIPSDETIERLREAQYRPDRFFVPLSNSEEIVHNDRYKKSWEQLIERRRVERIDPMYKERADYNQNQRQEQARLTMLREIAASKGIKELPEMFYDLSVDVGGLKVKHYPNPETFELPDTCLELDPFTKTSNVGTFSTNNGVMVVIAPDGRTYCNCYNGETSKMLRNAGYREQRMFVPLSNGEEITEDDLVYKKWLMLIELAKRGHEPEREDLYIKSSGQYIALQDKLEDARKVIIKLNGYLESLGYYPPEGSEITSNTKS